MRIKRNRNNERLTLTDIVFIVGVVMAFYAVIDWTISGVKNVFW